MQDVLSELLARVDDDTLLKMSQVPYWRQQIHDLLSNPRSGREFWHHRAETLTGVTLESSSSDCGTDCWKDIYYAVKSRKEKEDQAVEDGASILWIRLLDRLPFSAVRAVLGLGSVEMFEVMKKIYPLPDVPGDTVQRRVWNAIEDPAVLQSAIQAGLLRVKDVLVRGAIEAAPLLALLSTSDLRQQMAEEVISYARGEQAGEIVRMVLPQVVSQSAIDKALFKQASLRSAETIDLLLDRVTNLDVIKSSMEQAARSNNGPGTRVFLDRIQPDLQTKQKLFEDAYYANAEESMLALLEKDSKSIGDIDPYSLLLRSINNRHYKLIRFALQHTDPGLPGSKALIEASTDPEAFALILSDPRVDPMPSVMDLIRSSRRITFQDNAMLEDIEDNPSLLGGEPYTHQELMRGIKSTQVEKVADILIRDPRVDIESFQRGILRLVFWSLADTIADRIEGLQIGRQMAGSRRLSPQELRRTLELKNDIYAKLLRYIILKRPSSVDLIDWMTAQIGADRETFAFAAGDVLDDVIEPDLDVTPIWSLLQVMLYPTLTLTRLIDRLRTSDVDRDLITRAAQLVGAHIGAEKLR